MRLTEDQIQSIRRIAADTAGPAATLRVFGSRLRDEAVGGDLDLLVELPQAVENPAALSARLATRISRTLHGRRVSMATRTDPLVANTIDPLQGQGMSVS